MKEDTTFKYCVMTNYMNPILDGIKFFPTLERIISLFGLRSHRIQKLDRLQNLFMLGWMRNMMKKACENADVAGSRIVLVDHVVNIDPWV